MKLALYLTVCALQAVGLAAYLIGAGVYAGAIALQGVLERKGVK